MHLFLKLRYLCEYLLLLGPLFLLRRLPFAAVKAVAAVLGSCMYATPTIRKLVRANIAAAFPEFDDARNREVAAGSLRNLALNLAEFIWLADRPDRIRRNYCLPEDITVMLRGHVARGERILFVTPHLGSWEATGVMAPFYAGVQLAAIAKPARNPYINLLINDKSRKRTKGMQIIFSHGAMRAATKLLRDGVSIGILNDQNTRLRDGGEFVNFFGIPVAGSASPAVLKEFCDAHAIPSEIIFGLGIRHADGRIYAHAAKLSKPFAEYKTHHEVLQELLDLTEKSIREYPEQYLWFYKRFQYIPRDCPPEVRARYPYYAVEPGEKFYRLNRPQQA
ncbi:MAG: hypothetical protein PHI35_02225 [Victivallaceae bacterium]|nr:hypothetical protein [Victivallaceae bacterium]